MVAEADPFCYNRFEFRNKAARQAEQEVLMLKHIVLWTFAEFADGHTRAENMERVRAALMALPPLIPEIRRFEVHADLGIDASASTMCLVSEFEDADALQRYAAHPDHRAVSALISGVRTSRAVIDYDV